jgi:hypothetical protein
MRSSSARSIANTLTMVITNTAIAKYRIGAYLLLRPTTMSKQPPRSNTRLESVSSVRACERTRRGGDRGGRGYRRCRRAHRLRRGPSIGRTRWRRQVNQRYRSRLCRHLHCWLRRFRCGDCGGSGDRAPLFERAHATVQVGNRRLQSFHPHPDAQRQERTSREDEKNHGCLHSR